jgi:hypothetical protein
MSTTSSAPGAAVVEPHADENGRDPIATFYLRADALYRCATEACRQHERLARLVQIEASGAEQRAAGTIVTICDEALAELSASYERAAQRAHPDQDAACWHAANGLWLAAREYARRQLTSSRAGRGMGEQRDLARLTELALDYDLEASALLLLKQATEAYRKARPQVA